MDYSFGGLARPFVRGVLLPEAKAAREAENRAYPGGLRNPNRAVAQSRQLQETGARIRTVLEQLGKLDAYKLQMLAVVGTLGTSACRGFGPDLVETAQRLLRAQFGVRRNVADIVFDAPLWGALLSASGDPETEVPKWLEEGCPTGIGTSTIGSCGIFPPAAGPSSSILASRNYSLMRDTQQWKHEQHKNYVSFYVEDGKLARDEVNRIACRGFVETFGTWDEVLLRWPNAVASKVALVVKTRDDGSTKVRMIIDLRRSGGNGGVVLPERVVLPRLSDLTAGLLDLMECELHTVADEAQGYEIAVVDFEDAFHTLALREEDRGGMAIRTVGGWAVFRRLCCGMAAAPLIWCRVGAAAGRLGQALFRPQELRLQIFVDDPAIVMQGRPETRAWNLGILLLFWAALGFQFNWSKAFKGQKASWIGAQISIERREGRPGVLAELAPTKFEELKANIKKLRQAKGMVDIQQGQRVAGQLSWASGLFPWIRSFNTMLWGAITAHTTESYSLRFSEKKRPTQLLFLVRIDQAITWIWFLLAGVVRDRDGVRLPVQRWMPLSSRVASLQVCIRTDASPFGFGAILFVHGLPRQWMAAEWSAEDCELLKATRGDAAWQAEWELFGVLRAVDSWLAHLRGQALVLFQLDATAALHASARGAGRTPYMNALAAELTLRLESAAVSMVPEHLCSTLNFECDALSRLAQGASVPRTLDGALRVFPRLLSPDFFWAWPRSLLRTRGQAVACGLGACGRVGETSQPLAQHGLKPNSRARARTELRRRVKAGPSSAVQK